MQKYFAFFPLLFLLACSNRAEQMPSSSSQDSSIHSVTKQDTLLRTEVIKEQERIQRRREIEAQERNDSIQLAKVLDKALVYAAINKEKGFFEYQFEMLTEDSSINVGTSLMYGHLFSKK